MIIIVTLAGLAIWGLVATIVELRRDGFRAVPTDWARVAEHDLPAEPAEQVPSSRGAASPPARTHRAQALGR